MESFLWSFFAGLIMVASPGIIIAIGILIRMIWDKLTDRKSCGIMAKDILFGRTVWVSGRSITGNFDGCIDDYIDVDYIEVIDKPEITERT